MTSSKSVSIVSEYQYGHYIIYRTLNIWDFLICLISLGSKNFSSHWSALEKYRCNVSTLCILKQLLKALSQNFFSLLFWSEICIKKFLSVKKSKLQTKCEAEFFLKFHTPKNVASQNVMFVLFISTNIIQPHYPLYFQTFPLFVLSPHLLF